jgi:hypothetical protein
MRLQDSSNEILIFSINRRSALLDFNNDSLLSPYASVCAALSSAFSWVKIRLYRHDSKLCAGACDMNCDFNCDQQCAM